MAAGVGELPPASLILTGYNQSDLIAAAIVGAFSQDYPDLQIILTDDRSSDDTFSRMAAAARAYQGPHEVLANQTRVNLGTLGNICDAFARARGELIVFAGGDDISHPHRVQAIAECWLATRASAFYSRCDVIDESGQVLERDWKPGSEELWLLDYFPEQHVEPLHGASMACHRSVMERYATTQIRIRSEDAYLTLMLGLDDQRTEYIDQSLVSYRRHAGAITNEVPPDPTRAAVAARERTQMRFAQSQLALLTLFKGKLREKGPQFRSAVEPLLDDDLQLFALRAEYESSTLTQRLAALPAARRRRQLDWLAPRLAGFDLFVAAKTLALATRSKVR